MRYSPRGFAGSPWRDLEEVSNRLARMFDDGSSSTAQPAPGTGWMRRERRGDQGRVDPLGRVAGYDRRRHLDRRREQHATVSGDKAEERTEGDEERRYHVWERRYGALQRSFTLPRTVKADDIHAHFDNGILRIRMPKVAEAKGRKIQVQATTK